MDTASLGLVIASIWFAGASILDLIDKLRQESGLAVLLIAHDLRVVRRVADRAIVLHNAAALRRYATRPSHPLSLAGSPIQIRMTL